MTTLATELDLERRLGRSLTHDEGRRVDALLTDASAAIRAYTAQTITSETTTDRLRIRRGRVRLPQRPVTDVDAVTDTEGTALSFTWSGSDELDVGLIDVLYDWAWEPFRTGTDSIPVDVTYTHGYLDVPDDIVGVCAGIALRALGQTPTMSGITAESIEGYSYTIGSVGAAGGFGLLPDERTILDRYRRRVSYTDMRYLR